MTAPIDPVPADPTGRPVVFYSPHQDDETLFMGKIIAHHVLAGRQVHVVLCSNGSTSAARRQINGEVSPNSWYGGWHYPAREGYAPLSQPEFARARSAEFEAALRQLGVKAENIHYGPADSGLAWDTSDQLPNAISAEWAADVLTSWASHFTVAGYASVGHYTMHRQDPMPDHAALGQALADLRTEHPTWFGDARWAVKPEQATALAAGAYAVPSALAGLVDTMSRAAGRVYGAWHPTLGSYAIGYHSVSYFKATEALGPNYLATRP